MKHRLYSEVSLEIIDHLKMQGFNNLRFDLLDQENPYQAMVEIIPGKDQSNLLDNVSLYSGEIHNFSNWKSPMTRYVIERRFLKGNS